METNDYVTPAQFRTEHKRWEIAMSNHQEAVVEHETATRILNESTDALAEAYTNMTTASEGLTRYVIDEPSD